MGSRDPRTITGAPPSSGHDEPHAQHSCPCRPIAARIVLLPMCVPCPPRAKRCRPPRRCCRSRTFLRGRLFRGARLAAAIAPAPKNACPVFGGGGAGMRTGREARGRRSFGATREAGPECARSANSAPGWRRDGGVGAPAVSAPRQCLRLCFRTLPAIRVQARRCRVATDGSIGPRGGGRPER